MSTEPRCRVCGATLAASDTRDLCPRCAAGPITVVEGGTRTHRDFPSPHSVELPIIAGYRVLGLLGQGGMGIVFRAEQEKANNRPVAIKMILAARGFDADLDGRFEREVNAVSAIEHANIVRVYEVGESNGRRFFSMEYCPGGTLYDRLKTGIMLPREAAATVAALARAMEAVHAKGIVHRDLKPLNVLYGARGEPKIGDFGLAKSIDANADGTATGAIVGSLGYMSPEQASGHGKTATAETDIYALGAILYSCLTGRVPLAGSTVPDTLQQIQNVDPVPVRRLVPNAPRDLETICEKCLQKEPKRRYATAGALADDLERYLDGRPIAARPASRAEKFWKAAKRRPAATALVATLVLAGVGAAVASALLVLANGRERELRARADANALRADSAAGRARQFSEFVLRGLGETDPFAKYFPLHIPDGNGSSPGGPGVAASPEFLERMKDHATVDLAGEPHERAKVLLALANAQRSAGRFDAAAQTLDGARRAFEAADETTPEDRTRWRFCQGCLLHDSGELERADRVLAEIANDPNSPLAPVERADTHFRLAWLCADRSVLPGHIHSPSRGELMRRVGESTTAATALYRMCNGPTVKAKIAICELIVLLNRQENIQTGTVEILRSLGTVPHGDRFLRGYLLYADSEDLRKRGEYEQSIARLEELVKLADETFGPQSHSRALAFAGQTAIEFRAARDGPDPAKRAVYAKRAEEHALQGLALGRKISPRHPRMAEGLMKLAAVYREQERFAESRAMMVEARAIARVHPVDLKGVERQIDAMLAEMPEH